MYYTTKPPEYCKDACKAKAYRQRKRDKMQSRNVTLSRRRRQNNNVKTVFLEHQAAKYLAMGKFEIAYAIHTLALDIHAPVTWPSIVEQANAL